MEIVATAKGRKLRGSMNSNTESSVYNYTLNISKALHKKLEATKRSINVEYKFTDGGVVLTSDTVTFELFRIATLSYFGSLPETKGQVHIREITDKSHSTVVQHTIKVILDNNSYTVNIYNTTSRLLVNGNGANSFVINDIPNIHKNVIEGLRDQGIKDFNIQELNKQLGNELQKLLNNNQTRDSNSQVQATLEDSSSALCTKCHKKCRTRSIFCNAGNHWIHYKCQKLTEPEIQIAENSNDDDLYECKICRDTKSKSKMRAIAGNMSSCTQAKQLLNEETEVMKSHDVAPDDTRNTDEYVQICAICDNGIINPNWNICGSCNIRCHNKCMTEKNDIYTCIACIIIQDELEQGMSDNSKTSNIPGSAEVTHTKPTPKPRLKVSRVKPSARPRTMSPASVQDTVEDTTRTKLSELRTREAKTKKGEEQLKLKSKSLQELANEKILLETKCQQLEARNFELEQTVKLLKRRIESNEQIDIQPTSNTRISQDNDNDPFLKMKHDLDQRLAKLHSKLSNIVLDEMDKQLDKITLFEEIPTSAVNVITETTSDSTINPIGKVAPTPLSTAQILTGQPLRYKQSALQNQNQHIIPNTTSNMQRHSSAHQYQSFRQTPPPNYEPKKTHQQYGQRPTAHDPQQQQIPPLQPHFLPVMSLYQNQM